MARLLVLAISAAASAGEGGEPSRHTSCIEHAGEVQCLLFCSMCGHHGCAGTCQKKDSDLTSEVLACEPIDPEGVLLPGERDYQIALARLHELDLLDELSEDEAQERELLRRAVARLEVEREERARDYEQEYGVFMSTPQPRGAVSPIVGPDAPHLDPDKVHNVLVTGVGTSSSHSVRQGELLATKIGLPLKIIANSTGNRLEDVQLAYQAGNSPRSALSSDPTAGSVNAAISAAVEDGKPVRFWAHSKGARDVQLGVLAYEADLAGRVARGELTHAQRVDRLSLISVLTMGGADPTSTSWPPGVRVSSIEHPGDPIPKLFGREGGLGTAVGAIPDLVLINLGNEPQVEAHSLENYIKNAPPESLKLP